MEARSSTAKFTLKIEECSAKEVRAGCCAEHSMRYIWPRQMPIGLLPFLISLFYQYITMKKTLLTTLICALFALVVQAQTKKDGTPDMRYKANQGKAAPAAVLKKDGTPDMRYAANQSKTTAETKTKTVKKEVKDKVVAEKASAEKMGAEKIAEGKAKGEKMATDKMGAESTKAKKKVKKVVEKTESKM